MRLVELRLVDRERAGPSRTWPRLVEQVLAEQGQPAEIDRGCRPRVKTQKLTASAVRFPMMYQVDTPLYTGMVSNDVSS